MHDLALAEHPEAALNPTWASLQVTHSLEDPKDWWQWLLRTFIFGWAIVLTLDQRGYPTGNLQYASCRSGN